MCSRFECFIADVDVQFQCPLPVTVSQLFNVDTFKPLTTLGPHLSSVLDVCFAEPYGAYVAVDSDKSLSFW